ncbi:hypothetical protein CW358_06320 [Pseudomonas protegens]|nr:hypothetical protein CW358_06320 [Pseudomonas protegens]
MWQPGLGARHRGLGMKGAGSAPCSKALDVCPRHCAGSPVAALYMQQNLTRQAVRFEVKNAAARILRRLAAMAAHAWAAAQKNVRF